MELYLHSSYIIIVCCLTNHRDSLTLCHILQVYNSKRHIQRFNIMLNFVALNLISLNLASENKDFIFPYVKCYRMPLYFIEIKQIFIDECIRKILIVPTGNIIVFINLLMMLFKTCDYTEKRSNLCYVVEKKRLSKKIGQHYKIYIIKWIK